MYLETLSYVIHFIDSVIDIRVSLREKRGSFKVEAKKKKKSENFAEYEKYAQ